jgi:hypothetical protein
MDSLIDEELAKALVAFGMSVTVPSIGCWVARNGEESIFGAFQKIVPQA